MTRKIAFALCTAGLAAVLAVQPALAKKNGGRVEEKTQQSFESGAKGTLTLTNINGDVTVTGYDGKTIEVETTKYASSQERLEDIEVKASMKDNHVVIDVDMDGHDWNHDGHAGVTFDIKVPRGTSIDGLELVNGSLTLEGIAGDVDADCVNGTLKADRLSGEVDLAAVNGNVRLSVVGEVNAIRLHSVNGRVELVVPKDTNASVSASTVHGSIRGSGTIKAEKGIVGSSLTSVLGDGKGRISLDTVNGDIRILFEGEKDEG